MKIAAAILFALALAIGQAMQGGAQIPALSIPSFALIVLAAICTIPNAFRLPPAPLVLGSCMAFLSYIIWRALQPDTDPFLMHIHIGSALVCGLAVVSTASGFSSTQARIWLLGAVGTVLVAQLAIGLAQFTFGRDWMPLGWFSEDLRNLYSDRFGARTRGSFLNPNHFAWAMGTGCLMTLAFAVWGRLRVWARILMIYFSGVFLIGVVLSASRGGMIALAAGLLVFGALSIVGVASLARRGSRSILIGGGLILIVIAGAGAFAYQSAWAAQGRFQELLVPGVRSSFSEGAWRLFQTAPVMGVGPGEFLYAARMYRQPISMGDPMYVHNDWLQLMAEYGWIGFAFAVIASVSLFGNGIIRFFNGLLSRINEGQKPLSNESAIAIGCLSCLVLFATHSLVDFNLHIPANALLAAMVVGLLTSAPRPTSSIRSNRIQRISGRILTAVGFTGFGGGLIFFLATTAESDIATMQARNLLTQGKAPEALQLVEKARIKYPVNSQLLWIEAQALANYESAVMLRSSTPQTSHQPLPAEDITLDDDTVLEDSAFSLAGSLPDEERDILAQRTISAFRKALELRPNERRLHLELALALARAGNFPEARLAAMTAIERDNWSGYPLGIYGEILDMSGNRVAAKQVLTLGSRIQEPHISLLALQRIQAEEEMLLQLEAEGIAPLP